MTSSRTRSILRVEAPLRIVPHPIDHLRRAGFRAGEESVPLSAVPATVAAKAPDAILLEGAPPPNEIAALRSALAGGGHRLPIVIFDDLSATTVADLDRVGIPVV